MRGRSRAGIGEDAMNRLIFAAVVATGAARAVPVTIETSGWTATDGPGCTASGLSVPTAPGTSVAFTGNGDGGAVSDVSVTGDFLFSGRVRLSADDANIGFLFGWTDIDNPYPLGWEGGGFGEAGDGDFTAPYGGGGIWLAREVGGDTDILIEDTGVFWTQNQDYDVQIARSGGALTFSVATAGGTPVASGGVTESSCLSGAAGVHVESNAAQFTTLALNDLAWSGAVPLPAALPLLGADLAALGWIGRRRRA
jgi:hypothetical protein